VTCCAEAARWEEYGRLLHEAELQQQLKSRKQRPKKFRCPHCQVAFSNNGQLKGHVRIHTGGSISSYIGPEPL
jgi:huckebein